MKSSLRRWVVSGRGVVHDLFHLDERCNADQIKRRKRQDILPREARPCKWCLGGVAKK